MIKRKFGRWTVVEEAKEKVGNRLAYKCECECGNIRIVSGKNLRSGDTKSCGCLAKERVTKHGMHGTPEYRVWGQMIQRCGNPNNERYANYGGRGIKVCDRWKNFENFFTDMGTRKKGLTIERKNNDLGYFLENCCWATRKIQARNRRIFKNNTTGVNGVSFYKTNQKYCVQIRVNNKLHHIGFYTTIEEATAARKAAELKYW